jgi:hypothetical protein
MEIAVGIMFLLAGGVVGAAFAVLRWWNLRRRVRSQVRALIEQEVRRRAGGGKVEIPQGRSVWRRWAPQWLNYANSPPPPRAQSQRFPRFSELPRLPMRDGPGQDNR